MNSFIQAVIESCSEVRDLIANPGDLSFFESFDRGHGGDISSGFDLLAEAIFLKTYLLMALFTLKRVDGCLQNPFVILY